MPSTSFLITDIRIFTGTSTIEAGSVLVEDGRISQVSSAAIPYTGTTVSKPGHTLLPGLIDSHVHCDSGNPTALPQSLRFGVTTVCDLHNEYPNIQKLRKQIADQGPGECADLKYASFAATVEMGWPMPVVLAHSPNPHVKEELATWPKLEKAEDAAAYVQERVGEGVDYIKLMHESGRLFGQDFKMPSLELQKALIQEAHKRDLVTVAHATSRQDTIDILNAGVDGLAHTFCDLPPNQEVVDAYRRNEAHLNPTLATLGSLTKEGQQLQAQYAHDPRVQRFLPEAARQRMCACMDFAKVDGASVEYAYETVRQLKAAGVDILVGSDAAGPAVGTAWGLSVHQELQLLVTHCGFSPAEALGAATSINAKRFKFQDRGRIEKGLRADLVLVEGNPMEGIDHTLDLRGVWRDGVLCKAYEGTL